MAADGGDSQLQQLRIWIEFQRTFSLLFSRQVDHQSTRKTSEDGFVEVLRSGVVKERILSAGSQEGREGIGLDGPVRRTDHD